VQVKPVVVRAPARSDGRRAVDHDGVDTPFAEHRGGGKSCWSRSDDGGVTF
jgi:hypothetical protein